MRKNKKIISFGILSAMAFASLTSVYASTNSNVESKTIAIGDKFQVETKNATKYKWVSSNKSIATVNKKGVVTGKKSGTVTITGSQKGKKTVVKVKVVPLKEKETKTITAGETAKLNMKQYKGSTYKWTTSNKSVASVNQKGVVVANKEGTTVIRCYAESKKSAYIAQYTIKVNTEKKVATQAQLTKALQNKKITSLIIDTNKDVDFEIPEGSYQNVSLSVNAPNADVENYGVFKSIKILMIKPNTWHEQASGNRITVKALQARIVVEEGASVDAMSFTKKDANVNVEVNGTVSELKVTQENMLTVKANGTIDTVSMNAPASVDLEVNGTINTVSMNASGQLNVKGTTKNEVPVVVSDKAEGAKVNAAVKVEVHTPVKVDVSLEKGAEGSSVKVSDDNVDVTVKNETDDKVVVEKPSGNQEVDTTKKPTSDETITSPVEDTTTEVTTSLAEQSGLKIVNVESVENGKVRLTLNKAYPQLTQSMLSIICTTGGSDMTIQRIEPSADYTTFDIITSYYDDNGYSLAIVFSDKSLIEKSFVSKYDCPQLTSVNTTRVSGTEATLKYIADELGTFYYIVKENATSRMSTKAVHQVPNELDGITEAYMLQNGTSVSMKSQANEVTIHTLKEGSAYTIYYMAASTDGKTTLIKKIDIDSKVVSGDTSSIKIESAEGYYKYVSFFGENYRYEITLSEPTKEALTLDNFKISCPKGNLTIGRVETTDNQHYTVYMKSGVIPQGNNYFTATITFQDGTTARKDFYMDFDAPIIATTSSSVSRTGEKQLKVTLKSDEEGSIYWTILQPSDVFEPDTTAKKDPKLVMDANPTEQALVSGEGTFTVDLSEVPANNSYFCFVTKDAKGNYTEFMYYLAIPEYKEPEVPGSGTEDTTPKTFEITSVSAYKGMADVITLSFKLKDSVDFKSAKFAIKNNNTGTAQNFIHGQNIIENSSTEFQFIGSYYTSGNYTVTVTLSDGRVGTANFTIS